MSSWEQPENGPWAFILSSAYGRIEEVQDMGSQSRLVSYSGTDVETIPLQDAIADKRSCRISFLNVNLGRVVH